MTTLDTILLEKIYPKEWQEWLDTYFLGAFFTNQEMLEDENVRMDGWFNPFIEPEKLTLLRQECDMKPKHWREHVIENFPGINATEQYQIRRKEAGDKFRLERAARCRTAYFEFDIDGGELVKKFNPPCKQPDICAKCAEWMVEQKRKKLFNLCNQSRLIEVSINEEKKVARQLAAKYDNYERIAIDDDKTAFIIKTGDEIGDALKHEDCLRLAPHAVMPVDGRRGSMIKPKSEGEEKPTEERESIKKRCMEIEFDSDVEDAPKDHHQLNTMTHNEVDINHSPQTVNEVQWGIFKLEEKVKQICKRYEMSFSILRTKINYITMENVNWEWAGNRRPPG